MGIVPLFVPISLTWDPMGLTTRTRDEQAENNIGTISKSNSGAERACDTWLYNTQSPWFS